MVKRIIRLSVYVLLGLVLIVLTMIGAAPARKLRAYEQAAVADSLFMAHVDSAYQAAGLGPLLKEAAYKKALLALAAYDSIAMIISLPDSTVMLAIHGVVIHSSRISGFEQDDVLSKLSPIAYSRMFSVPVQVTGQYSTIVKEPIVERQAPKDTMEASLNAFKPDTLIQNPGFLLMDMEYGIRLVLEQDSLDTPESVKVGRAFRRQLVRQDAERMFLGLSQGTIPDYTPTITLALPLDDLRSVYRALPAIPYVVVRM
ncbi:MAG: hypothetical protein OEY56_13540 [Cyclobacteriaceae bacterium]|nr:hypothetical protein [Cyclobacteriaceae bacterium]